ncbi:hypothetical protein BC940DRAFT_371499 [Gongronella butleri]|nr:hypothetical protein BC940DRAFT_371499 [Gongronella butleri]
MGLFPWLRTDSGTWKKVVKCTVAFEIAIIFMLVPRISQNVGQVPYLLVLGTLFFNPSVTVGSQVVDILLNIMTMLPAAVFCGLMCYLCTLYNRALVYTPSLYANGAAVIAALSFFVCVLVLAYLRLKYRRLFVPMLQGFTMPFFILTRTFNQATFNIMSVVSIFYPVLIGGGIALLVNLCLWPETAAKASEAALGRAIQSIQQVVQFVQDDVFQGPDKDLLVTRDASVMAEFAQLNKALEADIGVMRQARSEAKYEVVVARYSPAWYKPLVASLDTLAKHLYGFSLALDREIHILMPLTPPNASLDQHTDNPTATSTSTSISTHSSSEQNEKKKRPLSKYTSVINDPEYDHRTTHRLQSTIQPAMARLLSACAATLDTIQHELVAHRAIPTPENGQKRDSSSSSPLPRVDVTPATAKTILARAGSELQQGWLDIQAAEYKKGDIQQPHLLIHALIFHLQSIAAELTLLNDHVIDLLAHRSVDNQKLVPQPPRPRFFFPGGSPWRLMQKVIHGARQVEPTTAPTSSSTVHVESSFSKKSDVPMQHQEVDGNAEFQQSLSPLHRANTVPAMFEEPVLFQQNALKRVESKHAVAATKRIKDYQRRKSSAAVVVAASEPPNVLPREEDDHDDDILAQSAAARANGVGNEQDNDDYDDIYFLRHQDELPLAYAEDNDDYDNEERAVGGAPIALHHAEGKHRWNRALRHVLHGFQQPETRYAIKFAITVELLALMVWLPIDGIVDLYNNNHGQWALLSAMVVFNFTVGSTALICAFRVVATVIGAVCGYIALVVGQTNAAAYPYVVAVLVLVFQVPMWYVLMTSKRFARIGFMSLLTMAVITSTGYTNAYNENLIDPTWKRTVTAIIAILVVMVVDQVLWPVWARKEMRRALATLLIATGIQFTKIMSMMCQPNQHLERYEWTCADCLVQSKVLQQQYQLVSQMLVLAHDEPRLTKGPFPFDTYCQLLNTEHRLLYLLDQMLTAQRLVTQRTVRAVMVSPKIKLRKQLAASVHLYMFTLAGALQTKTALPAALPTALPVLASLHERNAMVWQELLAAVCELTHHHQAQENTKTPGVYTIRAVVDSQIAWHTYAAGTFEFVTEQYQMGDLVRQLMGQHSFMVATKNWI